MLAFLKREKRGPGSRKLRLFACTCCRRIWPKLKGNRRAILAAEQFVDRLVTAKELAAFEPSVTGTNYAATAVRQACGPTARFLYSGAYLTSLYAGSAAAQGKGQILNVSQEPARRREEAFQAQLLRDIVGNPFRPVIIDPAWLTRTVVALAKKAYEKRLSSSGELESERLAILADALEDAGCTDARLLEHLRGPGPHVRGCWAVDLLLGQV
jgi:hypothetical protein